MQIFKLTRKQIIIRSVLLILLLIAGFFLLNYRADPHWEPVAHEMEISQTKENPYIVPDGMTQETRILPPEGFERVEAAEDSFLAFMRKQPLYPNGSHIYYAAGGSSPSVGAAAVYDLSLGKDNFQQCADTVIRFYSEYFWEQQQTDKLAFHFTNGFLCDYDTWKRGKRVLVIGDFCTWLPLSLPQSDAQQMHNYLSEVMRYAGTLSLTDESVTISAADAHAGDIICHGGSPGHVVLLADEAVNAEGERCFLIAQGFMPSQSAHIICGFADSQSPWYTQSQLAEQTICLSSYTFHADDLRRWNNGFSQ